MTNDPTGLRPDKDCDLEIEAAMKRVKIARDELIFRRSGRKATHKKLDYSVKSESRNPYKDE